LLKIPPKLLVARILIIASGVILLAIFLPQVSSSNSLSIFIFAIFLVISQLLAIPLPQGGLIPVGSSVILASIILFEMPDALAIVGLGILLASLIKETKTSFGGLLFPISENIIVAFVAANSYYLLGGEVGHIEPFRGFFALLLFSILYFATQLALDQLSVTLKRGVPYLPAYWAAAKFLVPSYLAFASLGVLLALMYLGMRYWSFALFFLPLLVTRHSLKLFVNIRNVYRKTIEALASAIEAQDPQRHGHALRVARHATDIAKELGIYGRQLELISYAALLHDVGMMGVEDDSLDALLEVAKSKDSEPPHAAIGGEILEQIEFLSEASNMVRFHHTPASVRSFEEIPIGARIINVASYFDELTKTRPSRSRLTPTQAINKIRKEQGIRFDPKVVRAFANVLRKQGKILTFVS
jgi:putative nucleotidyltransferase with HDIG domain